MNIKSDKSTADYPFTSFEYGKIMFCKVCVKSCAGQATTFVWQQKETNKHKESEKPKEESTPRCRPSFKTCFPVLRRLSPDPRF